MLSVTGRYSCFFDKIKQGLLFKIVPFQGYSGSDGSLHPANGEIIGRSTGPPLPDRIPVSLNKNIHLLTFALY